ncbi:MAG: MgtC/SapB family protein, partial [Planctomycetes bacterium]|nr:MgtC/SapB family protein [Planctomycetota bacterium]
LTAFFLGGAIGYERQYRQRTAGLRTNVLVALGAAVFVDMANRLYGHEGAIRVAAYVVSGIGFLGAGVIMRNDGNVLGLNTAATLWCSAAVGACAGGDLLLEAAMATVFILAANTLLRPVAGSINKKSVALTDLECEPAIYVIAGQTDGQAVLEMLEEALEKRGLSARRLDVHSFGNDAVEIEAVLDSPSTDVADLDDLVDGLALSPLVSQAFWSRGVDEK